MAHHIRRSNSTAEVSKVLDSSLVFLICAFCGKIKKKSNFSWTPGKFWAKFGDFGSKKPSRRGQLFFIPKLGTR